MIVLDTEFFPTPNITHPTSELMLEQFEQLKELVFLSFFYNLAADASWGLPSQNLQKAGANLKQRTLDNAKM